MDERALQIFLAAADLGSFGKSAEALGLTQPTLSRRIAAIESELGTSLFVRHTQGVSLTPAGLRAKERARRILRDIEALRGEGREFAREPAGRVVLGIPAALVSVLGGPAAEAVRVRHPGILLQIRESFSDGLERMLAEDEADLAVLISARRLGRRLEATQLASEDLMIIGPRGAGLDPARPRPLTDVAEGPMILNRAPNHLRWLVEVALRKRGIDATPAVEVDSAGMLLDLVRRGLGRSLMPRCVVAGEIADGQLAGAPARGLRATWTLAVAAVRPPTSATRAVEAILRETARERVERGLWQATLPCS